MTHTASSEAPAPEGYTYRYPRAALTVDCVVFAFDRGALHVLLVERGLPPFEGAWALPGGFVQLSETLEEAARRELFEETGLEHIYLEELQSFSRVDRDPRDRVVSVAFVALVQGTSASRGDAPLAVRAGSDAARARFFEVGALPTLAFDHAEIVECARERLRTRLRTRPVGFELLPERFPLRALQALYETVLGRPLDKRNFRKRVLSLGVVVKAGAREEGVSHRAAELYRFDEKRYRKLERSGFAFEIG